MSKNYVCSFCGKEHVKLWRPYMGTEPLICAECAEKFQAPQEYEEKSWRKEGDCYIGTPTGKKLTLPKWTVDEKGKVPSYFGPTPDGIPQDMTDQLIVDISKISTYQSGQTTMISACPNENGDFWGYTSVPENIVKWWEDLPTR